MFTIIFIAIFLSLIVVSNPVQAQAVYDTVSIHDLQWVPNPDSSDASLFFGDTVVVRGLVMTEPRDLWVGARWAIYIQDADTPTDPWNGFFIIQHDTFAIGTGFQFVQTGDVAYFTGVVDEFENFTQVALLTNPAVPVNVESAGNPLPAPVVLQASDLATYAEGEQWESMFVGIDGATIVNNNISGNWASYTDASSATGYLAEYFNWLRDRLQNGTISWPPNGTLIDVVGFTQDEVGTPGRVYVINPRYNLDWVIHEQPPTILPPVMRDPGAPANGDVEVSAVVVDNNFTISEVLTHYSVNWGAWQTLTMSANPPANQDTFLATIPGQNNSFVRYFVTAKNTANFQSSSPGDTSMANGRVFWYNTKGPGLSIKDVQFTYGYAIDISGYVGYEVSVDGIVMTDSTDFLGSYYIEEKDSAWYGIWVNSDGSGMPFDKGDEVNVTGIVEENFNVTRLNVTSQGLLNAGVGAFEPVIVTTGEVTNGGANAEAYEGIFIKTENITVTDPFPDAPSNFGEFTIDDGSGGYRVDDLSSGFRGNLDSLFKLNDVYDYIQGMGYYSFGNYKLIPRDSNDVGMILAIEEIDRPVPVTFSLSQNYPNPFNPTTDIEYTIAKSGNFNVVVYNILGQKIRTLANEYHTVGSYRVRWDGLDDFGNNVGSGIYFYSLRGAEFKITKKMILLK
jgi:hypothetical protein